MNAKGKRLALLALCLAFSLTAATPLPAQSQPQRPPEYNELVAASQIKDAAARLKEFERIKAAYPASRWLAAIDRYIFSAKVELAESLDAVLAIQKEFLASGNWPARVEGPFAAANQILTHPMLKTFDKAAVLAAVLNYRDLAVKVLAEAALGATARGDGHFTFTLLSKGLRVRQCTLVSSARSAARHDARLPATRERWE